MSIRPSSLEAVYGSLELYESSAGDQNAAGRRRYQAQRRPSRRASLPPRSREVLQLETNISDGHGGGGGGAASGGPRVTWRLPVSSAAVSVRSKRPRLSVRRVSVEPPVSRPQTSPVAAPATVASVDPCSCPSPLESPTKKSPWCSSCERRTSPLTPSTTDESPTSAAAATFFEKANSGCNCRRLTLGSFDEAEVESWGQPRTSEVDELEEGACPIETVETAGKSIDETGWAETSVAAASFSSHREGLEPAVPTPPISTVTATVPTAGAAAAAVAVDGCERGLLGRAPACGSLEDSAFLLFVKDRVSDLKRRRQRRGHRGGTHLCSAATVDGHSHQQQREQQQRQHPQSLQDHFIDDAAPGQVRNGARQGTRVSRPVATCASFLALPPAAAAAAAIAAAAFGSFDDVSACARVSVALPPSRRHGAETSFVIGRGGGLRARRKRKLSSTANLGLTAANPTPSAATLATAPALPASAAGLLGAAPSSASASLGAFPLVSAAGRSGRRRRGGRPVSGDSSARRVTVVEPPASGGPVPPGNASAARVGRAQLRRSLMHSLDQRAPPEMRFFSSAADAAPPKEEGSGGGWEAWRRRLAFASMVADADLRNDTHQVVALLK